MNMKRLFVIIGTVAIFSLFFCSCYYDNEEVLYPSFGCDTTNVSYDSTIVHIMDNYCTGCHSGQFAQGGVSLTTYEEVVALEPRITPAIDQTGKYPMPLGGRLKDCQINQWDQWVHNKMPK